MTTTSTIESSVITVRTEGCLVCGKIDGRRGSFRYPEHNERDDLRFEHNYQYPNPLRQIIEATFADIGVYTGGSAYAPENSGKVAGNGVGYYRHPSGVELRERTSDGYRGLGNRTFLGVNVTYRSDAHMAKTKVRFVLLGKENTFDTAKLRAVVDEMAKEANDARAVRALRESNDKNQDVLLSRIQGYLGDERFRLRITPSVRTWNGTHRGASFTREPLGKLALTLSALTESEAKAVIDLIRQLRTES